MSSTAPIAATRLRTWGLLANRVIGLFPELLGFGGVQEAGRLTAAALSEIAGSQGAETFFLSLNDPPGSHEVQVNGSSMPLRGVGRAKVRFSLAGIAHAEPLRRKTNGIVIAMHPHLAIPADLIQRISPLLKVIVMTHGVEVWRPLSRWRRRALRRADLVFAPSRYTASMLTEVQGVRPERIRVLPWPLNPDFQRLAVNPENLPLPANFPLGLNVLTVGRWAASERYKGADELIRAIAQLRPNYPTLNLVVVGEGDDLPRLQRLASELGVADRAYFFSELSREQLAGCYSRADIFALPSTGEGFGFVFLEAMVFAKPLVAATFGGPLDLIQDGVNGALIPAHDTGKLAETLATLLRDESLRARMGLAGAEIVRASFSFEIFKQNLACILDGVQHATSSAN